MYTYTHARAHNTHMYKMFYGYTLYSAPVSEAVVLN